jgi:hypothetical protein
MYCIYNENKGHIPVVVLSLSLYYIVIRQCNHALTCINPSFHSPNPYNNEDVGFNNEDNVTCKPIIRQYWSLFYSLYVLLIQLLSSSYTRSLSFCYYKGGYICLYTLSHIVIQQNKSILLLCPHLYIITLYAFDIIIKY